MRQSYDGVADIGGAAALPQTYFMCADISPSLHGTLHGTLCSVLLREWTSSAKKGVYWMHMDSILLHRL